MKKNKKIKSKLRKKYAKLKQNLTKKFYERIY